ncbi:hypothetical protein BMS3Abin07_01067 [bacterium BMS3Abin07]|nr:hypothetical protein BMS3Abin07_01067 [bacterium BMS3Abin07]GBE31939.1 hypothetical protein BMS3Bbin05_00844 [bacterium BMS3Bbin05]HDL20574.1 type II toxin-antitoxin system RelE/ParE family toxin [Nitrospirota bacterium]HDO23061.1 type II toxin-antitoxin system RelE/ParE family toxin [Nitrospirota bacterium]HDZ88783.1 type II toxin-antitoxin system RelE/ParE family toxin [Nitrospirota bacterium]
MIGKKLIYEGSACRLYGITVRGRCLVREFIEGLQESDRNKVVALLQRAAGYGSPRNEEKFKHLRDRIYEFKSYQVRILCAFDMGKIIILTHGFIKKGKTPQGEIQKAVGLLNRLRQQEE